MGVTETGTAHVVVRPYCVHRQLLGSESTRSVRPRADADPYGASRRMRGDVRIVTPRPESSRSVSPQVPLPEHLQVEVTAACNLRCRMCLAGYREPIDRRSGSIDCRR